ncbi:inter-alpha-trypsin inhibitor heavy chain H3-like [Genypterus blacodes]|uniref:inter-alpha-trypsin inhibitor heavy chain H3-like n=1 Tax=Genypterus blacodes TaxID=154954 RepID=UPI003F7782AF
MTTKAVNNGDESQEIFFEVDLPKTAFISNFSMEIEGKLYVSMVKEKAQANDIYDEAVSSGQTAGLVQVSGRTMEKFSVSVNIAGQSDVTFVLTYEELLQRKMGRYEILTRVKPKHLVQEFKIVTNIYEPQGLLYVDVWATFLSEEQNQLVEKTVTSNKAHISFSPTMDQQRECEGCHGTLIDGDFIVKYDVKRVQNLGEIQIVNGYFVHFFAPPDLERIPKNVAFVIDRSGSMWGQKMQQTRDALLEIINDLSSEDHFALIPFDHSITPWRYSFSKATKENVAEALGFVGTIDASGLTNINDAVLTAVNMLITDRQANILPERSTDMIILLTDGMPTSGVTVLTQIQNNVRQAIGGQMSLFCLGFGNNVDYSFLNVMAQQNKGLARRIFEASDATLQLRGFYDEVASPLLLEVDLRYPDNTVDVLTTNHFSQLFNGSELIVAGRLSDNNFMAEVVGIGSENDFIVQGKACPMDWDVIYPDEEHIFGDYIERLWAYLTIQQLQEKSNSGTPEEKASATTRALELSLQYNFVTPLTSMVVVKPENTDSSVVADKLTEEQRQEAERNGKNSSYFPVSSQTFILFSKHLLKQNINPLCPLLFYPADSCPVDGDPHFIIELPEREDALCFNVDEKPGTILNLVTDPTSGILVNGEIIGDKQMTPDGHMNTYFWRFGIIHKTLGVKLEVTTQDISVFKDGKWFKLQWSDSASLKSPNMDLRLSKDRSLLVTLKDSVKFLILLHKVWEKHPYHQNYLGFYTLDSHLLSSSVHGLLGQFYHGIEYEVTDLRPGEVAEKPDATMHVKGQELNVTRGWQRDFRTNLKNGENIPCWFIHSNGTGLIDGEASDYIVSGLFKTVML